MALERPAAPAANEAEFVARMQNAIAAKNISEDFLYDAIKDTCRLFGGERWQEFDEMVLNSLDNDIYIGFYEKTEWEPYHQAWIEIHPNDKRQESVNYHFRNQDGKTSVVKVSMQEDREEPIELNLTAKMLIARDLMIGLLKTPKDSPDNP